MKVQRFYVKAQYNTSLDAVYVNLQIFDATMFKYINY